MYELRPTQAEATDIAVNHLQRGRDGGLLYASCGWGKSIVIANIAKRLGAPVLVLQPSIELLIQNYEKMMSYEPDFDVTLYSASANKKEIGQVTYATVGSIKDYTLFKGFKYILLDEAQLISPKDMTGMYGKLFRSLGNPTKLGFTGTPFRLVQKFIREKAIVNGRDVQEEYYTSTVVPLNRIPNLKAKSQNMPTFLYKNIIYTIEMETLMRDNWLVRPQYDLSYSKPFDYSNLKMNTTGNNFDNDALEEFVTSPNRLKQAFQACKDFEDKGERSNLVFCASVGQAEKLAEMLRKSGSKAESLRHDAKDRKDIINRFKNGDTTHLINYKILGVGFDHPPLGAITVARPIISPEAWVQIGGRVVRKDPNNPNKIAMIADVAGVSKRLGRIETIRVAKEEGGFRNEIVSEVGILSNKPLFKFRIESERFKKLVE